MIETSTISHLETSFLKSSLINIPHAMFNRHGGVSVGQYSSLNLSYGVGDVPKNVTANRHLTKKALGASLLLSATQVHADKIFCSPEITSDMEVDDYDALITDQRGVALLIQQADCQAILLYEHEKHIIAAIHCGWRGNVINIIESTIQTMHRRYQTDPTNIQAVISPSLGPCCAEFINYKKEIPESLYRFKVRSNHFNFWEISRYQLVDAGVFARNIDICGICTSCSHDYFSYRRSKKLGQPASGRNGSMICLPPD